jgi:hypothetical protein
MKENEKKELTLTKSYDHLKMGFTKANFLLIFTSMAILLVAMMTLGLLSRGVLGGLASTVGNVAIGAAAAAVSATGIVVPLISQFIIGKVSNYKNSKAIEKVCELSAKGVKIIDEDRKELIFNNNFIAYKDNPRMIFKVNFCEKIDGDEINSR